MEQPVTPPLGSQAFVPASIATENARVMSRVYGWMTAGLCLTGAVAWNVSGNPELVQTIFGNRLRFWALIIAQLGAVPPRFRRSSTGSSGLTATLIYFLYAGWTGLTLSSIFLSTRRSTNTKCGLCTWAHNRPVLSSLHRRRMRRELVGDSVSNPRGRLRYSVALVRVVSMTASSFRAVSTREQRSGRVRPPKTESGLAGDGQFVGLFGGHLGERRLQGGKDESRRLLDHLKAFRQQRSVAVI